MDALYCEDIAVYAGKEIDYDQVRATIGGIAESIDNAHEGIMDATIRAADNDDAVISMAMVIMPESDIISIIDPNSKYADPVYFFRGDHGTALGNIPRCHLTLEMGYLLRQYEASEDAEYAPGVVFGIGDEDRDYFTILCVIDYDDGDVDEAEFGNRAENMLLAFENSVNDAINSVPDESLMATRWGTFDGIPLVECVRR